MSFGVASWSLGVIWRPRGLPGGCPMVIEHVTEVFGSLRKSVLDPLETLEMVLWAPPSIIVSNLTPGGGGLVMKVLWDDNLTPFSSDKIRAKILDLGYGGARRALHNLSPKSARILSAAITRTILLPAGARRPVTKSTRG